MRGYDPKYPLSIATVFIEYKGKILLTLNSKFGFWRVASGRIEMSESPEKTLEREIKEELGISISVVKLLGFCKDNVWAKPEKKWISRLIIYFLAKTKTNKLKMLESEVSKVKWVSFNEIKKVKPLEPVMRDLFREDLKLSPRSSVVA